MSNGRGAYQAKPERVEAAQVLRTTKPKDVADLGVEWDALHQQWLLPTPAGRLALPLGTWVVRHAGGDVSALTPEEFARGFEKATGKP